MVTYSGDNQTLLDAGGASTIAGGMWRNKLKVCLDFYTITGAEASGSIIQLFGTLMTGMNIVEIVLNFTAAQTSLTLSVGDSASATRYASADTGPQTAGLSRYSGKGYVIGTATSDNQIILTTGGATMTAATLFATLVYTEPAD